MLRPPQAQAYAQFHSRSVHVPPCDEGPTNDILFDRKYIMRQNLKSGMVPHTLERGPNEERIRLSSLYNAGNLTQESYYNTADATPNPKQHEQHAMLMGGTSNKYNDRNALLKNVCGMLEGLRG